MTCGLATGGRITGVITKTGDIMTGGFSVGTKTIGITNKKNLISPQKTPGHY